METLYKISSIMIKKVVSVEANKKISTCAKLMKDNKIGALIVTDKKKITGIITDQDLTRKVVAQGLDPNETLIKEIMSSKIKTVKPGDYVSKAVALMRRMILNIYRLFLEENW